MPRQMDGNIFDVVYSCIIFVRGRMLIASVHTPVFFSVFFTDLRWTDAKKNREMNDETQEYDNGEKSR